MSDVSAIPDYSLAAESAGEHLRNSLVMLGALGRILVVSKVDRADAQALVEAISARLEKALQQVEDRHEFGCTAYVGRACICATLRKQRAFGSRPAATQKESNSDTSSA